MKHTLISFDYAMKGILRDKANFVVLSGLLSELLGRDVAVFEILESESNAENRFGKSNKLDLKAKIDGGEIAIFEIQTGTQNDFFHRILFGTSKAVVEQLHRGDGYWKIKKVYSIDIVYFELGKGSDYIYHGFTEFKGVHNNEPLLLSEQEMKYLPVSRMSGVGEPSAGEFFPEYYMIYPDRFDENIKDKFDEWVYVLKNSVVKEDFSAAGIREAGEALNVAKMSEFERIDYEDHLKFNRVRNNEIDSAMWKGEQKGKAEGRAEGKAEGRAEGRVEGRTEGRAEGRVEGKAEGKAEVAQNLKKIGMPADQISAATGLSIEEIENI